MSETTQEATAVMALLVEHELGTLGAFVLPGGKTKCTQTCNSLLDNCNSTVFVVRV